MARFKLMDLVDWYVGLRARRRDPDRARRGVLLVSSGGLGDTILFSLMAPRFMALAQDGEPVHVLVQSKSLAVAFLFLPGVDLRGVDYRRFLRSPLYRLRASLDFFKAGYRLAISTDHLRLPTEDDAIVLACGAEQTMALEPRSWPKHDKRLQANRGKYSRWVKVKPGMAHRMARWTELANALTGRDDPQPIVSFDHGILPPPAQRTRPFVILHPFSAISERQHPPELFRLIIKALPSDHDVILSMGPGDLAHNPRFRALLDFPNVTKNEAELIKKMALIRAARLVVSVDTSVMHLAVGAGAPTLCVASAAHVVDSIPYDSRITPDNVTFLFHDMDCRGCLGACVHPLEDGMYPCVARLDHEEAAAKALVLLEKEKTT